MHCMVYHIPAQIRRFKNIIQFSGQGRQTATYLMQSVGSFFIGLEKNNDSAKHNFYSSNRQDACGEVLKTEK